MRKFKVGKISWVAFILVAFAAGCGREQAPVLVPAVIVTSPLNIATGVVLNSTVTAGFNIAMTPATINATTFTLVGPGAVAVTGTVTYTGTTATLTPTASLAANTLYVGTITIGAQSANGVAMAANYVWSFTTGAPTVISTVPAGGATLVAVNTLVSATFSEPMNAATINGVTFTLTGPGVTPVAGAVTYAGTTATFTPATVLAANTLFTATITTGAQDPAGAALAANFVWTFTTVSQPKVTSTNPTSGATNVPINQKITATFSEPMSSSTIVAAGTFTVAPTLGGAAVTGTVTYDAASNTAIFTPSAALAISTEFTATITTAAQNPAGKAIASTYVWSFTTGTVANATAPTVVSTDPVDVATLVPLNQKITATFSNAMNRDHLCDGNIYGSGHCRRNSRARRSHLRYGQRNGDIHANGQSSREHSIYRDDFKRGQRPVWQRTDCRRSSESVELYDRHDRKRHCSHNYANKSR